MTPPPLEKSCIRPLDIFRHTRRGRGQRHQRISIDREAEKKLFLAAWLPAPPLPYILAVEKAFFSYSTSYIGFFLFFTDFSALYNFFFFFQLMPYIFHFRSTGFFWTKLLKKKRRGK